MFIKTKFIKIKNILRGLPWLLGKNAFLSFLALLFLAFLLSSVVFYRYVFAVKGVEIQGVQPTISFNNNIFQEVLIAWEVRAQKFDAADFASYRNIFQPSATIQEAPEEELPREEEPPLTP